MLEEFKWILIHLFIKVKRGGGGVCTSACICMGTQSLLTTESLDGYSPNFVGISTQDPAHLYSLLGQIRLGADPKQGHITSMRGPFSKELLLQSGMLQQQTECIAIIYKHLGVLMTPTHLYWLFGQIRTVVDPGQGHNRSMRALLQRTTSSELEGHSNKPNV